jgi:hypothetical protein
MLFVEVSLGVVFVGVFMVFVLFSGLVEKHQIEWVGV